MSYVTEEQFELLQKDIKALNLKLNKFKVSDDFKRKMVKEQQEEERRKKKAEREVEFEKERKKYKFRQDDLDEFMEDVTGRSIEGIQDDDYYNWGGYSAIDFVQMHPDIVIQIVNLSNEYQKAVRNVLQPLVSQ